MTSSKIHITAILIASIISYGCEKHELVPNVCLNCEFECLLDSVPWDAQVTSCYLWENIFNNGETTFSVIIKEINPLDGEPDHLAFSNIPVTPGHYTVVWNPGILDGDPSASLQSVRNGYPFDNYIPVDSLESFVNVEAIDLETREWRINFTLALRFSKPDYVTQLDTIYPRSFSITNGFAKGQFPED